MPFVHIAFLWTNTTNLYSSCGNSSFSDLAWFYPWNERTLSRTHQLNSTVRLNLNRVLSLFMIARWYKYNLTSSGYTFFHHFLIWYCDLYRSWIDSSSWLTYQFLVAKQGLLEVAGTRISFWHEKPRWVVYVFWPLRKHVPISQNSHKVGWKGI